VAKEISLTEQLQRFSEGDREMAETVLIVVLPRLHEIAVSQIGRERFHAPLTPTELINEAWLRNLGKGGWPVKNRGHFYAIAARAMRHVLVDFARSRLALSRGEGVVPISLDEIHSAEPASGTPEQVVEIGMLMERLEKHDPSAARIVEMHHFAGFSLEEIADVTKLSFRKVRHLWEKGRDWLKEQMSRTN
jgi:RNA polymerase sigma factor (TIGR02999 family)